MTKVSLSGVEQRLYKTIVGAFINVFSPTQMAFIKKTVLLQPCSGRLEPGFQLNSQKCHFSLTGCVLEKFVLSSVFSLPVLFGGQSGCWSRLGRAVAEDEVLSLVCVLETFIA